MVSAAARFATAKTRAGSNHINPGAGVLIIQAVKFGTAPEFSSGTTFVVEGKVDSCEPYKGVLDARGKEKQAGNVVGSVVGWIKTIGNFQGADQMFWDDVRTFLMTALGETEDSLEEAAKETNEAIKKDPTLKRSLEEELGEIIKGEWTSVHQGALIFTRATNREENPLAGMKVGYSTYEKKSKKSGDMLTLVNWSHIEQTAEEIEANKKKIA